MSEVKADFDYESYAAGYRAAVCDMHPIPVPVPDKRTGETAAVLVAYLLGVCMAYLIFKWSE